MILMVNCQMIWKLFLVKKEMVSKSYYLVSKYAELTGYLRLRDARPAFGQNRGNMVVAFEFTPEGGEKFDE